MKLYCFVLFNFYLLLFLNLSHFFGPPKYYVLKLAGSISDLLKLLVCVFLFPFSFTNPLDLIKRFIYLALK